MNKNCQHVVANLKTRFGDRLSTTREAREGHAKDACHHAAQPPDAVIYPWSNEEVAEIVRLCDQQRVPVIPFGTGTGVEGGVVAVHGGISVDLTQMKRVVRLSVPDMDVTVQSGVTRNELNRHLEDVQSGLFFPVDPGADASLGGMSATNASGSSAVGYGTMRENVLALTAIVPPGHIIHTGNRVRKSSAGYDLTRLFVGSEGTLGVITEVTLRLARTPEAITSAVCGFADIELAVRAAMDVITAGIPVARIELLDEVQIDAVNRYSRLDHDVAPTLFLEFHGSHSSVREQAQRTGEIVRGHQGKGFQWAAERAERDRLWQARYDAYYASLALRPGAVGFVTDVCVPISQLANCVLKTKEITRNASMPAPLFGHVGDGNFHVVFPILPDQPGELAEVQRLNERIVECALELDGTCSGEHGIGLGKIKLLRLEKKTAIHLMIAIKQGLDPHNVMNPGKVFSLES